MNGNQADFIGKLIVLTARAVAWFLRGVGGVAMLVGFVLIHVAESIYTEE